MKPVNLYILASYPEHVLPSKFENVQSQRSAMVRDFELDCLRSLVRELLDAGCEMQSLAGFFYSYTIEHIGKEFDLLKIIKYTAVINIEMKSSSKTEQDMLDQLNKNAYYLKQLDLPMFLFSYLQSEKQFYQKQGDVLIPIPAKVLADLLNSYARKASEPDLENLFVPDLYLVSPINNPRRFLNENYFLTAHQVAIKKEILEEDPPGIWSIHGEAGTGKTLFLLDMARTLAQQGKKVIYLHNGALQKGHRRISGAIDNLSILSAAVSEHIHWGGYDVLIVDDAQRLSRLQIGQLLLFLEEHPRLAIFGYDPVQVLTKKELFSNVANTLENPLFFKTRRLTRRIRSNPDLLSFTSKLFNQKQMTPRQTSFKNVEAVYARTLEEAKNIIFLYKNRGYRTISYSPEFADTDYNGLQDGDVLMGQEFESSLIILDDGFFYENKVLKVKPGLEQGLADRLLYQGLSRTRNNLALLVWKNEDFYDEVLDILYEPFKT